MLPAHTKTAFCVLRCLWVVALGVWLALDVAALSTAAEPLRQPQLFTPHLQCQQQNNAMSFARKLCYNFMHTPGQAHGGYAAISLRFFS